MSDQIRQAIDVLKRDKKKLGLIIGLFAVGLLLWGRLMLKQVPRTATAEPSGALAAAAEARRELAELPSRKIVRVDLPESLSRDPFQVDPTVFPKVEKPVAVETQAKSVAQAADVKQDTAARVRQAATGLALQTTILGDSPRALINGQLLAPGETIRGFELKKVMPREVILEMSGVELKLEM